MLPKVSPEGVVVPKDTDKGTLEKAVIDKVKETVGKVTLPDGVTITVEENQHPNTPGTETPGVKVKVKLPTGEIVELEVPVTVTPKRGSESQPNNGGGNDGNNYRPTPTPQNVPSRPTAPEQPVTPTEPGQPVAPAQADATVATDSATQPATPKYVESQKELPNTGTEAHAGLATLGLLGALSGFGLLSRKKKEE